MYCRMCTADDAFPKENVKGFLSFFFLVVHFNVDNVEAEADALRPLGCNGFWPIP